MTNSVRGSSLRSLTTLSLLVILFLCGAAARAAPMVFQRSLMNTGGKSPELCLRFAASLDSEAGPHYADHVRIAPALRPDVSVRDHDLCVGGLSWSTRYTVTLSSGMHDAKGATLVDPVTVTMSTGDRSSTLSLAGDGFILPRHSAAGLDVQTVNTERVRLSVWRLSPNATESLTSSDAYPKVDTSETSLYGYEFKRLRETHLSLIWSGTLDTKGARNESMVTAFPIARLVEGRKQGLYLVTAEDARVPRGKSRITDQQGSGNGEAGDDDQSESLPIAAHWVNVSDMALTTLRGTDGLHVYARALSTALPVKGAAVRLVSQGGDDLGQAVSDGDGQVVFPAGLIRGKGADQPISIVATSPQGDFLTVSLTQAWFDFSDRGAEGLPALGPQQAVIVTDRGIYRPGESINATILLRDSQGKALETLPLTVILRRPDGVKAQTLVLKPQEGGGVISTLALSPGAAAGSWSLEAYVDPTSPPVGRAAVLVQDFVPQTIAVDATPARNTIVEGQKLSVILEGRYLYGAPAAHLHGEGIIRVLPDDAPVPGLKGFVFGLQTQSFNADQQAFTVPDTDDAGRARVEIAPDLPSGLTLPLKTEIKLSLFDPSGRSVSKTLSLPVARTRPLLGLRVDAPADGGDETTQSVPVDVIALAPDNRPIQHHTLNWTLVRENETYDWIFGSGSWSFNRHVIDEPLQHGTVTTDAKGAAHFASTLDGGRYRVIIVDPQTNAASSQRFATGWWSDRSERPNAPDRLSISVRDKVIPGGGKTMVHVQAPFAGKAQIVMATDRVQSSRTVTLPKEGLDIPVEAQADWSGGAYVLVTAFRPLDAPARAHEPARAVCLAYVGIDQSAHHLGVTVDVPSVIRPQSRSSLPLTVKGGKRVHLVVSAVDQGILALTQWKLPDAFDLVYGRRAFGLDVKDSYAHLLTPVGQAGEIREGGDEGGEGGGVSVTSTRIVSLFSGSVVTDAEGHVNVPFDVPDFEGTLHLMVTAWSEDALGSAEADLLVRDPLFVDMTLPRYLAPEDRATSLVSLVNTEGEAGHYGVSLNSSGPVHVVGPAHFEADLPKGGRQSFATTLQAAASGTSHLTARLTDRQGHVMLTRSWDLQVRPGHMPITQSREQKQNPGQSYQVPADLLASYEPGSSAVTLGYSGVHGLNTIGLLQNLEAGYSPDTASLAASARGLLLFKGHDSLASLVVGGEADKRITTAIAMMIDREDAGGRFGSWRLNDGQLAPWEQIYVVDFLVRAKEAGYAVPQERLDQALDWLELSQVQSPGDETRESDNSEGAVTPQTRTYALYVLARAGRLDVPALRGLGDRVTSQGTGGSQRIFWGSAAANASFANALALGHLAGGLALGNERSMSDMLFGLAVASLGEPRSGPPSPLDRGYWTYLRDLGGLIPLAAESGNDGLAQKLTDRFAMLDVPVNLISAETSTTLLEAASAMNRPDPARGLSVNGSEQLRPLALPLAFTPDVKKPDSLKLTNTGKVPLWLTITTTGTPKKADEPIANGFTLSVASFTLEGKPYDPAHSHQNDRFLVVIDGAAQDSDPHHCVLTDLLPAGWEIESSVSRHNIQDDSGKPVGGEGPSFLGETTTTSSLSLGNDRLFAAFDLAGGSYRPTSKGALSSNAFRLAYIVRAVTPGQFLRPETVVRDRFIPALMGRSAASRIDIAPR